MNQKLLKSHTILAICILILSIIPVVAIGPYLHQFADDYVFGAPVYKAWTATHSFGACIQAAWLNPCISTRHGRVPIRHVS